MDIGIVLNLFESFKTAAEKFISDGGDRGEVKEYLDKFRGLAKRNVIEKDISRWIPRGWEEFKGAVDGAERYGRSKTENKRNKRVGKSITLKENDRWLIVVPLDKDASCFHGKNTKWCTTKRDRTYYEDYFYTDEVTLIYCLNKESGEKFAIAFHDESDDVIEMFDENDRKINLDQFKQKTGGLDAVELVNLAEGNHGKKIDSARADYHEMVKYLDYFDFFSLKSRDRKLESYIIKVADKESAKTYIRVLYSSNPKEVSSIPDSIKVMFAEDDSSALRYMKNASEKVQLVAVNNHVSAISNIDNPSEKVQLVSVGHRGNSINFIDNPSEKVQMAAVRESGNSIKYIDNPSEKVQMAAIQDSMSVMMFIENPAESVQLLAIKQNPGWVKHIKNPHPNAIALAKKIRAST